MAGWLDSMFDPSTYQDGAVPPGWLGLLAPPGLNLPQATPAPPAGPGMGSMGGAAGYGAGADLPPQAAPAQGQLPPQAPAQPGAPNPFAALFGGGQQAPAAQAPQQSSPSLLDHLSAAWQGLGHGGLTSAVTGAVTGQRADPEGRLQEALVKSYGVAPDMAAALVKNPQFLQMAAPQILAAPQQQATTQALIQAGVPAAVAHAAALNPEVLKTIAPQLYQKPTFTQIGEDQFGAKQYGFVQPDKMSVTPAGAAEAGAAQGAGGGGFLAPGVKQINSQLAGDDYLKQFSPEVQSAVQAYVDGRAMPTGNPRKGFTQTIKQIAQKYGQDIGMPADDTTFGARSQMRKNLSTAAPNSLGGQINIGNTAIGHLEDLSQKALDLGNWDVGIAPLSHGINEIRGLTSAQSAKMEALQAAAQHYGQEITKFYAGSPGGESERNRFMSAVSSAKTPQELAAVIQTEAQLAHSRVQALDAQIRGTLGEQGAAQYPVVRPETQKALERINGNVDRLRSGAGPQQAQQQPQSQLPKVGSVAEAQRLPKGSHFLDPNGVERVVP